MPVNRGQGQQSTRWYKLCFVPTSDSSDDSDTESVVLAPSTSTPIRTSWQELSPPHPTPPPPNPEPQIRWPLPPPPPPPLPYFLSSLPLSQLQARAAAFDIELQHVIYQPHSPRDDASLDHDDPHSPRDDASLDHDDPIVSPSVVEQGWPEEADDLSECLLEVPDGVINAIRRVRISELQHEGEKPSHCPICMEEFKVDDQACQLPCNHAFRSECILRWLNTSKTCPVCRLQLDGWEVLQDGSDSSIGDNSLDPPQPQIPPPSTATSWEYFFPSFPGSQVSEDSIGYNSDEANHDSVCYDLSDDRSYPQPRIPLPPPSPPYFTDSTRDLLPLTDSAGDNSDEANYDSACDDDLGDSHEDGDMVGNYRSGHGSQIHASV